uniref:(northern house mosquito) hypothetical protein n=1 Tax=Culex pipiens TaxID=7175 RepID=A0A8D8GEJ9_CULPI
MTDLAYFIHFINNCGLNHFRVISKNWAKSVKLTLRLINPFLNTLFKSSLRFSDDDCVDSIPNRSSQIDRFNKVSSTFNSLLVYFRKSSGKARSVLISLHSLR